MLNLTPMGSAPSWSDKEAEGVGHDFPAAGGEPPLAQLSHPPLPQTAPFFLSITVEGAGIPRSVLTAPPTRPSASMKI